MKKNTVINILKNILIWSISLTMIIPLLLILINSFKEKFESQDMSMVLPKKLHFENYSQVVDYGHLVQAFMNSLIYACFSVVILVLLAAMAAYVFSRNKSKLNRFLYFFAVLGIAMPVNYVTLTKIMQLTHLYDTRLGIILLHVATGIPFNIFLIYGFIGTVPRELDEAGVIDGCKPLRLFFSIILPLLKPVIVTVIVLSFMGIWNDFQYPLYFTNSVSKFPMTIAVYNFFGQFDQYWNLVCADIVLTCLPVIVVYAIGQKYIISGMTSGSVKG